MKRILILKRSSFGDIVHTLPVIPHLRRSFPEAEITWLTEVGFGPLVSAARGVDKAVEIGFRSLLLRGRFGDYVSRLRGLLRDRYDALIDFQGSLKSWMLIFLSKAERKIGFDRANVREPLIARFYSERLPALPPGLHVIRRYLRLLRPLGIETDQILFPEIEIDAEDRGKIDQWFTQRGLDDSTGVIAVNPFTAWRTKCWPLDHASALCRLIHRELGLKSIVLAGPKEEGGARHVVQNSKGAALLAPRTSILRLAALLRRVRLYVGGDTGPTQLATALGVPTVALFGPTDPQRNGPFSPDDLTLHVDLGCEDCSRKRCSLGEEPECMHRITPDMVLDAVKKRLG